MTPAASAPSFKVLQEAAEWFAVLRAPAVPSGERQRWRQWHDADPSHQIAWRRVEAISGKFDDLPGVDKPTAHRMLDAAAAKRTQRRSALKMLTLLCGTGLGAWAATQSTPWRAWTAAHHTSVGERRQIQLADGGTLWLNTGSAVDVDYGPQLRRVVLVAGEILVSTAPDTQSPARPLSSTPPRRGCARSARVMRSTRRTAPAGSPSSRARWKCARKPPARPP